VNAWSVPENLPVKKIVTSQVLSQNANLQLLGYFGEVMLVAVLTGWVLIGGGRIGKTLGAHGGAVDWLTNCTFWTEGLQPKNAE